MMLIIVLLSRSFAAFCLNFFLRRYRQFLLLIFIVLVATLAEVCSLDEH